MILFFSAFQDKQGSIHLVVCLGKILYFRKLIRKLIYRLSIFFCTIYVQSNSENTFLTFWACVW